MANAEQEPTMEEILASIRRIINEDEEEAAPAEAEAASTETESEPESDMDGDEPQAEAEAEAESEPQAEEAAADDDFGDNDDVLELTERVEDDMSGTDPMSISDDLMIVDREEEPEEPELEPEPEVEPEPEFEAEPEPAPKPAPAADDESLLGDVQSSAASSAFAALSENLRVSSEQGLTLEGIVREMLRPMLKQWLDENLPSIVEEKVQAEIERVARRRH
ncbi:DUF2497 domain-containing protein [Marinicauda sp. Alg238-R41]|uniref:DUF2497 domain-containing protein n=1 Tax=Marinicauda sp. Alg238-R41 TaxID=2993447 RepID=UPI0022E13213|nr:DUF2497 domain-containing protein [Marinicauda sp. Alg238-R41]